MIPAFLITSRICSRNRFGTPARPAISSIVSAGAAARALLAEGPEGLQRVFCLLRDHVSWLIYP